MMGRGGLTCLLILLVTGGSLGRGLPQKPMNKGNNDREVLVRMQKLRDALQMGDTIEYRRYWQELMESSPGWYVIMKHATITTSYIPICGRGAGSYMS